MRHFFSNGPYLPAEFTHGRSVLKEFATIDITTLKYFRSASKELLFNYFWTVRSITKELRKMKRNTQQFGPWALITGANAGIGAAFAHLLAKQGYNLALVGRRLEALQELSTELTQTYGIQTRDAVVDLSEPDFLSSLAEATEDLDIGLLISNAGGAAMGAMLRVDLTRLTSMLRLNTQSHLELAHHFGRRFEQRGNGGIVLVSSTAGLQGTPFAANYAGAKAYLLNVGTALNYEMKGTGVNVTVLLPGPTRTPGLMEKLDIPLHKLPAPMMNAETVAKIGLRAVGRNKPFVIAGQVNRIMSNFGVLLGKFRSRNMWGGLLKGIVPPELKFQ
jgi:short-subunit dehydrogenase